MSVDIEETKASYLYRVSFRATRAAQFRLFKIVPRAQLARTVNSLIGGAIMPVEIRIEPREKKIQTEG